MKVWMMTIIFVSSGAFRILKNRKNASVVISLSDAPIAEGGEPALFDDEGADVEKLGAEPSQEHVAPASETNDTNIQSCGCPRIRNQYSYLQWPESIEGYGCVGGCGGSEFRPINRAGVTIKELLVYTRTTRRRRDGHRRRRRRHIKAIRITYNDDHRELLGTLNGDFSSPKSFKFLPGEYVVDDLKLSGAAGFLEGIEFKTSGGRTFKAPDHIYDRQYLFPTGNSYMAAFTGRESDTGVTLLGVIFWKPISHVTLGNLKYPTLDSLAHMKSPVYIGSKAFCNLTPLGQKGHAEKLVKRVKEGTESCMQSTSSRQFGMSVKTSGGIPLVVQVETEAWWKVSTSSTRSNCQTKVVETTRNLNFVSPWMKPFTKFDRVFSQWQGTLSRLPYTAVARITFTDNKSIYRRESGTYEGVSFQKIHDTAENYATNITSCR